MEIDDREAIKYIENLIFTVKLESRLFGTKYTALYIAALEKVLQLAKRKVIEDDTAKIIESIKGTLKDE